jgi:hypothetical protein
VSSWQTHLNVLIIFLWAAAEELAFRGSVLTALLRFCSPPAAIVGSAVLCALEHMGSYRPNWTLHGVWLMDGICFAIAYLFTASLWMPTVWHAAHNLGTWCMGWFVVQLAPSILQVAYRHWGSRVTALYGLRSAAITLATIALFMRATRKKENCESRPIELFPCGFQPARTLKRGLAAANRRP